MYKVTINGRIVYQTPNINLANAYNALHHNNKGVVKKK